MSQHSELAAQLGRLYRERRARQAALAHCEEDLSGREAAVTPADGWPGKNEEARKAARLAALAGDETIRAIRANQSKLRDELAELEGIVDEMEAQRRGLEWDVRERLAQALAGRHEAAGPAEDAAFDDGADQAVVDDLPF